MTINLLNNYCLIDWLFDGFDWLLTRLSELAKLADLLFWKLDVWLFDRLTAYCWLFDCNWPLTDWLDYFNWFSVIIVKDIILHVMYYISYLTLSLDFHVATWRHLANVEWLVGVGTLGPYDSSFVCLLLDEYLIVGSTNDVELLNPTWLCYVIEWLKFTFIITNVVLW